MRVEPAIEPTWLSASDQGALRDLGRRRSLRAGSTLFMEGDDPADLMIIETGDVKLTTTSSNGREVVLDVLGPDELLGELSAIDGVARSASAIALTDVEVISVPVDRFLAFLREHPVAMGALLAVVVRRLRSSNRRQLEFSTSDSLGRVCARLDELATRYGTSDDSSSVRIELQITQTELAQWCGLSREAVVRALRKLCELGWLSTSGGTITIDDREQLSFRGRL